MTTVIYLPHSDIQIARMPARSLVTDQGLRTLTNLRVLDVTKNRHITDYGISHLPLTNIQAYKSLLTSACKNKIYRYRKLYTGSRGNKITTNIANSVEQ